MNNEEQLKNLLSQAISKLGANIPAQEVVIERSKDKAHGDYASNIAMKSAKLLHKSPVQIANDLLPLLNDPIIAKVEIAGPGFINFFLNQASITSLVTKILSEGSNYGKGSKKDKKIDVEFVSANPTGNLHLGHTRCAVVGDDIVRLYKAAGYQVTSEYYLNDCGNQIEHLYSSLRGRYHELFGEACTLGEDDYHGIDIIDIAKEIKEKYGDKYLVDNQESHDFFLNYGKEAELKKIFDDMNAFDVHFDVLSKESDIRKSGAIEKEFEELKDYIYQQDGATFLRTTAFLDDKDRALIKSDGNYTYVTPDIAYHFNKASRGFDQLIDVLGSDHHGYINRMKSALMMKGYPEHLLEAEFVQVVRTYKDGKEVRMSKRTGEAITHRELVEEVGKDAVRYLFAERAASAHLDFDYNLALEQSANNPVYYAQYAHARCCSILELGKEIPLDENGAKLKEEEEMSILKHLNEFPSMIESAANSRSPNRVTIYIHDLASLFHEFYSKCRVIDKDQIALTSSRLALVKCCQIVLENALELLGVSAPKKM